MEVRENILKQATRLFAAQGVGGTSLQEIADAVGVAKPSLLYHFPSKEQLHKSVLDKLLSRWNESVPRLLKAAAREDRFDAILDETIDFFAADADRARLLLREMLDRPEEIRELLLAYVRPWLGVISDSIRKAQEQKLMRPDVDPEAYVLQVMHLVVGSFAAGPSLQVLLPRTNGGSRLVSELKRVARAALMLPQPKGQQR